MASNLYRLSVRRGPEEGQTFPLTSSSVTVGRDPMVDIVFSDPEVSRQHARFTRTEAGYQLQDLGSTNGTFVDGRRLGGEVVTLQPGAVVTMGSNVTLVYEAAPDPMATVISADSGLDFDEEAGTAAEDDSMRTMLETPEEPFGGLDDEFEEEEIEAAESEPASVEYPMAEEPEALPDESDEDMFSFDEADFGEPATPGSGVASDDRTVLDMEASDFSYSSQEREEESLPSFDDSSELPSFEEEPAAYTPPPAAASPRDVPPPPPIPPAAEPADDSNRRRNIIIGVIVLLLLCCCCALVMYFFLGDPLLELLQQNFQF